MVDSENGLPEHADKIVPGYWGDMLFNLSTNGDVLLEEAEVPGMAA
jgi:hypothetical protein